MAGDDPLGTAAFAGFRWDTCDAGCGTAARSSADSRSPCRWRGTARNARARMSALVAPPAIAPSAASGDPRHAAATAITSPPSIGNHGLLATVRACSGRPSRLCSARRVACLARPARSATKASSVTTFGQYSRQAGSSGLSARSCLHFRSLAHMVQTRCKSFRTCGSVRRISVRSRWSAASRSFSSRSAESGHLPASARSSDAVTPTSWAIRSVSPAPQQSRLATLARAVRPFAPPLATALKGGLHRCLQRSTIGSTVQPAESVAVAQHDAPRARQLDRSRVLETGQGAGDGLDREAEVVSDVLARHRQARPYCWWACGSAISSKKLTTRSRAVLTSSMM